MGVAYFIVLGLLIGSLWGVTGIYYLNYFYEAEKPPTALVSDIDEPGDYSILGKVVFLPSWVSAQLTTPEGKIYTSGQNSEMGNIPLYILSVFFGTVGALFLIILLRFFKMMG